jgi:hypothetical protein
LRSPETRGEELRTVQPALLLSVRSISRNRKANRRVDEEKERQAGNHHEEGKATKWLIM